MKIFKCVFEAQKGNPGHKNPDFNPIKTIVVQSKFKGGARDIAEEELQLWDREYASKYRAPVISQATELELADYESRKQEMLGEIDNGSTEFEDEKNCETKIDVLEFPITQPWKINVGLLDVDGQFRSSIALVNSKDMALAFGNIETFGLTYESADLAICSALESAIASIVDYMSEQFGSSLDSTVRIIKGYCTLKEQEKLNRIKETILINSGGDSIEQHAISEDPEFDSDALLMESINHCINNYNGEFAPEPEECYESLMNLSDENTDIAAMAEAIKAVKNPFVMTHSTTAVNFVQQFKIENPAHEEVEQERNVPISEEGQAMLDRTAEESRKEADKEWPKDEGSESVYEGCASTVRDRLHDYDHGSIFQSLAHKMLSVSKDDSIPTKEQYGEIESKLAGVFNERNIEVMNGEFYSVFASEMINHARESESVAPTLLNLRELRKLFDEVASIIGTGNEENTEGNTQEAELVSSVSGSDVGISGDIGESVGSDLNEGDSASGTSGDSEWDGGDDTGYSVDDAIKDLNEALDNLAVGEMLILDDIPNEVYHAVKGISSSNIKEEMISSLYRHNKETGEIERSARKCFDFGNYIHTLLLQPHLAKIEYAYERELPEGGFDSTESLVQAIEKENESRTPLSSNDELKAIIEKHNSNLPGKLPITGNKEEIAEIFETLPEEFKLLGPEEKENATTFKKYIMAFNDTLPTKLKTNGTRDALLAEIAKFDPAFVEKENDKKPTLPTTGTKKDLAARIRSFKPDAVFKHELDEEWKQEQERGLIPVSIDDVEKGQRIVASAMSNPAIKNWYKIENETTACERSYFVKREYQYEVNGKVEIVHLIFKARLDKEIGDFILDTKTIEMRLDVKEEDALPYIYKEIEKRGYHISAAHYLDVTGKGKFFWIFHNKLKGYEWEFIMEISPEHLELGQYEIADAVMSIVRSEATKSYKAPITQPVSENGTPLPLRSQISNYANSRLEMFRKMNGEEI
ncbi:hypothetical protein ABLB47_02745 [Vibrio parahaemolyticus]